MLSVDDKGAGSTKVRKHDMCARIIVFEDNTQEQMQHVRLGHAREKFARVKRPRCGVQFTFSESDCSSLASIEELQTRFFMMSINSSFIDYESSVSLHFSSLSWIFNIICGLEVSLCY